jgi:hypothetical protein
MNGVLCNLVVCGEVASTCAERDVPRSSFGTPCVSQAVLCTGNSFYAILFFAILL